MKSLKRNNGRGFEVGEKRDHVSAGQAWIAAVQVVGFWEGAAGMAATVLPLDCKIWEDSVFFILIEAIKYTEKWRGRGLLLWLNTRNIEFTS